MKEETAVIVTIIAAALMMIAAVVFSSCSTARGCLGLGAFAGAAAIAAGGAGTNLVTR